jgi:hypothetical protein
MKMILCRENLVFAGQLAVLAVVTGIVVAAGRLWIVGSVVEGGLLLLRLGIVAVLAVSVYFTVAIRVLGIEDVRLIYALLSSKCALLMPQSGNKGI